MQGSFTACSIKPYEKKISPGENLKKLQDAESAGEAYVKNAGYSSMADLRKLDADKLPAIRERADCKNAANEVVIAFENQTKAKLNIIIRAYNDGITFRYEFPGKQGSFVIKDELTA